MQRDCAVINFSNTCICMLRRYALRRFLPVVLPSIYCIMKAIVSAKHIKLILKLVLINVVELVFILQQLPPHLPVSFTNVRSECISYQEDTCCWRWCSNAVVPEVKVRMRRPLQWKRIGGGFCWGFVQYPRLDCSTVAQRCVRHVHYTLIFPHPI